jgi:DNA-directed RNA polymerase specialized sigma24 family protein
MSVAAAARLLGTTEGAVKLRAFHAYQEIRKALDEVEKPPPDGETSR